MLSLTILLSNAGSFAVSVISSQWNLCETMHTSREMDKVDVCGGLVFFTCLRWCSMLCHFYFCCVFAVIFSSFGKHRLQSSITSLRQIVVNYHHRFHLIMVWSLHSYFSQKTKQRLKHEDCTIRSVKICTPLMQTYLSGSAQSLRPSILFCLGKELHHSSVSVWNKRKAAVYYSSDVFTS